MTDEEPVADPHHHPVIQIVRQPPDLVDDRAALARINQHEFAHSFSQPQVLGVVVAHQALAVVHQPDPIGVRWLL